MKNRNFDDLKKIEKIRKLNLQPFLRKIQKLIIKIATCTIVKIEKPENLIEIHRYKKVSNSWMKNRNIDDPKNSKYSKIKSPAVSTKNPEHFDEKSRGTREVSCKMLGIRAVNAANKMVYVCRVSSGLVTRSSVWI